MTQCGYCVKGGYTTQLWFYKDILSYKYILYWKCQDIYRFALFNNKLSLNNFINCNNIQIYYIKNNH